VHIPEVWIQAQASVQASRAAVSAAGVGVANSRITAPQGGRVGSVVVVAGSAALGDNRPPARGPPAGWRPPRAGRAGRHAGAPAQHSGQKLARGAWCARSTGSRAALRSRL
jgi:hypothetical protein